MENKIYDILVSTKEGAKAILDSVIEDYGVMDVVQCLFFGLNEADQDKFLLAAQRKMKFKTTEHI